MKYQSKMCDRQYSSNLLVVPDCTTSVSAMGKQQARNAKFGKTVHKHHNRTTAVASTSSMEGRRAFAGPVQSNGGGLTM